MNLSNAPAGSSIKLAMAAAVMATAVGCNNLPCPTGLEYTGIGLEPSKMPDRSQIATTPKELKTLCDATADKTMFCTKLIPEILCKSPTSQDQPDQSCPKFDLAVGQCDKQADVVIAFPGVNVESECVVGENAKSYIQLHGNSFSPNSPDFNDSLQTCEKAK